MTVAPFSTPVTAAYEPESAKMLISTRTALLSLMTKARSCSRGFEWRAGAAQFLDAGTCEYRTEPTVPKVPGNWAGGAAMSGT